MNLSLPKLPNNYKIERSSAIYTSILSIYLLVVIILFFVTARYISNTFNSALTVSERDSGAQSVRINTEQLTRVLDKIQP